MTEKMPRCHLEVSETLLDKFPLEGIKIKTLLKVTSIDLDYHNYDGYKEPRPEPYTQISIDGFVLLGVDGCVLDAGVQINAEYGYTDIVHEIKNRFAPGTIHWVEATDFFFEGDRITFYNANFNDVEIGLLDSINAYFPVQIQKEGDLAKDEFIASGKTYKPGTGKFFGHKWPVK